jgi:transposase-like protein
MAGTAVTPLPPECPKCRSRQVVLAFEGYSRKTYFCPDCEHVWDVTEIAPTTDEQDATT